MPQSPNLLPWSSTRMHDSANESLDHGREVVEFCSNIRPSKNICVRDPKLLGFFPTSECARASHSGVLHRLLKRCRCLQSEHTIPQKCRSSTKVKSLIFAGTLVPPKNLECATPNCSNSFRRPFSDHLPFIDTKCIFT